MVITSDEKENRYEQMRKVTIEGITKLVQDEPDKYDANKLQEAIDEINSVSDENLAAFLIMQKELDILQKPIYKLTDDQIKTVQNLMSKHGYTLEYENVINDEPQRSDYQARYAKNDEQMVIWFNRMRPLFSDGNHAGEYNLLCIDLWFPSYTYKTFDELMNSLDEEISKRS